MPAGRVVLNLPLMNRAAAKEKRGSSGPSRSYLQTRVRASRLQNAAILAFIELSRRLNQAYARAYDKSASGQLLPQNPPGTRPRRVTNPNCLKNAVKGSPGVGDPFKTNVNDPSMAGHIGAHALAPEGIAAEAVTLAPLAGKIIKTHAQDTHGNFYVDVRLANGNVAVYFDLQSVRQASGSLQEGDVIGITRPGNLANKVGLHVTIVRGEYYNDFNAHRGRYTVNGPTKEFIDPLGPESPINCPGEKLIQ